MDERLQFVARRLVGEPMAELCREFSRTRRPDQTVVWVFPNMAVCLHCGDARFTVLERELTVFVTGTRSMGRYLHRKIENLPSATGICLAD